METLDATLTRILFHKTSKWSKGGAKFLIGKVHTGTVVKGEMTSPVVGESYRFYGEFREQKPPYGGVAFEFLEHEPIIERSTDGLATHLAKHVPGLGPVRSLAIVEHFGLDTLDILREDPGRILEIEGIPEGVVGKVRAYFESDAAGNIVARVKLAEMFAGHKVARSVVDSLIRSHGANAPDYVRRKPYDLLDLPRMGWETVDAFAMATLKYPRGGIERHAAAIAESLMVLSQDGHTWAEPPEVQEIACKLLGMAVRPDAWREAVADDRIIGKFRPDGSPVWVALAKIAAAEETVARRLVELIDAARPFEFELDVTGLQGEQVGAAELIAENGVAVLTGAPGTGKTVTMSKVISSCVANGMQSIRVAAPTGKAAKRAAEAIAEHADLPLGVEIPCTTIHRLLAPMPSGSAEGIPKSEAKIGRGREEFDFGHNEDHPIDADLLIMDETSMQDVSLAAAVLKAVPLGTRILYVGDQNQLPSVGPGAVLRDIMDALPSAYLTEIRRSQPGRVVQACHAIKDGRVPMPAARANLENGENWYHIELDDPRAIARQIVDLVKPYRNFPDPVWDIQVVTPQKSRLPIACDNLNRMLSDKLNPRLDADGHAIVADEDAEPDDEGYTPDFRVGDKVVRTKNGICQLMIDLGKPDDFDWSTGTYAYEDDERRPEWRWENKDWSFEQVDVVNGDMGTVLDVVEREEEKDIYVVVQFRNPDRLCRLPYGKSHLIQAYAMTCHKAQGSGFPFVIVPVHESWYWNAREQKGLFTREWIYTAISRAEKLLVTVGQFSAIADAVGRKTVHRRKTRLAGLLRERLTNRQPSLLTADEIKAGLKVGRARERAEAAEMRDEVRRRGSVFDEAGDESEAEAEADEAEAVR